MALKKIKMTKEELEIFIEDAKEELRFMGYLYSDLAKITYIKLGRIKAILSYNLGATDEEITLIKKALGL
jgi:hypothetical protein